MRSLLRRWSQIREHVCVLAGYTLLTLIFTYPMVLHMGSKFIGDGGDTWYFAWNLWWTKKALLDLHTNPFFTSYLYYPQGASLYLPPLTLLNGLLSIPLQTVFGLVFSYNFVVLFSFVMGGYGAYLLARYLIGHRGAAFIAGMIFTLSPDHLAHTLGHLNLVALEWIPFYVLFLLRALKGRGHRDALLASLFLLLAALTCPYSFLYLLLFTAIALAYYLVQARSLRGSWKLLAKVFVIGMAFLILFSPVWVPTIREASQKGYVYRPPSETILYSADLLSFFVPGVFHPVWGQRAMHWRRAFFGGGAVENTLFVGYTVLALALLGPWKERRKVWLWGFTVLFFAVMSLGPILHINGRAEFTPFQIPIVLPYAFLCSFPLVRIARTVVRMGGTMVMLSMGILAGYGVAWLDGAVASRGWLRGRWAFSGMLILLTAILIGFEFLPIPFPMVSPYRIPPFYHTIAKDQEEYTVLDVPFTTVMDSGTSHRLGSKAMYYQTVHNKKIFGGYLGRRPRYLLADDPVLQELSHITDKSRGVSLQASTLETLNRWGFRYIVLHKEAPAYLTARWRMEGAFVGKTLQPFVIIDIGGADEQFIRGGFYDKEPLPGRSTGFRWTKGSAQMSLPVPGGGEVRGLSLKMGTWGRPPNAAPAVVSLYLNDKFVTKLDIERGMVEYLMHDYWIDVPTDLEFQGDTLELRLEVSTWNLRLMGVGQDSGELGIALDEVGVYSAPLIQELPVWEDEMVVVYSTGG